MILMLKEMFPKLHSQQILRYVLSDKKYFKRVNNFAKINNLIRALYSIYQVNMMNNCKAVGKIVLDFKWDLLPNYPNLMNHQHMRIVFHVVIIDHNVVAVVVVVIEILEDRVRFIENLRLFKHTVIIFFEFGRCMF